MKGLPEAETYEQGLQYWPYKKSWQMVFDYICKETPANATLLDLMCGPGHLLGQIAAKRKDLKLKGVDIDKRYMAHSSKTYPHISFETGDILTWEATAPYDAVICTGALHHIPYDQQENAVKRMASMVKQNGFVIISDPYIDDYSNEKERRIAAAKLGYEYLKETINNGAPGPVIEFTIDILWNDVMMKEFKTSLKKRSPVFDSTFSTVQTLKTWPDIPSEYGDYISICRKKY